MAPSTKQQSKTADIWPKIRRRLRWMVRYSTSPLRVLPDFIIIGAQKGGTSALNHYIAKQHPNVRRSMRKEVHYYDRNFHKSLLWYRAYFPVGFSLPEGVITGEASPYYLAHPHAPRRIAEVQPGVKMIALLRNPKDRALSHYHMSVRKGRETLSFDEAVRREEERIGPEWQRMVNEPGYESVTYRAFSYKHRGRYAEQLRRYYEHFDASQILIMSSDAFRENTPEGLRRVCRFLEIPTPESYATAGPRHTRSYSREMNEDTERYLDTYFTPLNQELYELVGEDFEW